MHLQLFLRFSGFKVAKQLLGKLMILLGNTLNAECILTMSAFVSIFLKCWDLKNSKKFPRKHAKQSQTTVLSQTVEIL